MINKVKFLSVILCAPLLAGCATMAKEPTAMSHKYMTPDKSHVVYQFTMHTGAPNTPQQTVTIIYNKVLGFKHPVVSVDGQTKTASEEFKASVMAIFGGVASAAVGGHYQLLAAEAKCPKDSLCGTLVQVQNTAGAAADSSAESSSDSDSSADAEIN